MIADPYTPPSASLLNTAPASPAFFVVSKRKFALLYVLTCGMYFSYWLYRNWKLQRAAGSTVFPLTRTVFHLIFIFSLFVRIDRRIKASERQFSWYPKSMALGVVMLSISSIAVNWVQDLRLIFAMSLLAMGVQIYCYVCAQEAINCAENDVDGLSNSTITWANGIWIALGVSIWALLFYGAYTIMKSPLFQ